MARKYRRDKNGQFAGGGGGSSNRRGVAPRVGNYAKNQARSAGLRAAARGVTVSQTFKGVEVRANVSVRPAPRDTRSTNVTAGRIPAKRTGRRRARR